MCILKRYYIYILYIYISALERAEQKQSLPHKGAFNRDNDLGAPHLFFLSKAIPQCHDSHTLFLTLKLCAQWSPDSLHLWKRITINLAVEDVQMISSSQKNVFESFILNSLELYDHRQLLESSNLKIALVSNATGHTLQLGLIAWKTSWWYLHDMLTICCMILRSCRPWQPSDKSVRHLILASTGPTSLDSMIAWHTSVLRTGDLNVFDMSWRLPR